MCRRKYRVQTLGRADDAARADGLDVLSFGQAEAKARAVVASPECNGNSKIARLTVRQAMERYIEFKHQKGQPVRDVISRSGVHILPALADLVVSELTAEQPLARGHGAQPGAAPGQGQQADRAAPVTDEDVRRRRASANRVLTMLKAALNHAYDEGHVANRDEMAEECSALLRQHHMARLAALALPDRQCAGVGIEVAHFQPRKLAVAAAGFQAGTHQRAKIWFARVDEPLCLCDCEIAHTRHLDLLEWSKSAAPGVPDKHAS